jgi:hypothetical protein
MKFSAMFKKTSAFLTAAMSLATLLTVLIHIILFGMARQADEGAAAHIFQLLLLVLGLQAAAELIT